VLGEQKAAHAFISLCGLLQLKTFSAIFPVYSTEEESMPTALFHVPELSPYLSALRRLGYSTVEQLLGAAQNAGPELQRYLGTDVNLLLASIPVAAPTEDPEELARIANAEYPLGVAIEHVPPMDEAPMIAAFEELPASVNLVAKMPPIQDQKQRGTCVAFATLGVFEHSRGSQEDFSEQFLYAKCKELDDIPNVDGTYLGVAFPKALAIYGCCLETTWPYNPVKNPANIGQGPAGGPAVEEAQTYLPSATWALAPTSIYDIKSELAQGRCVAFSIPVFNSWYKNPAVQLSGDIIMPLPGELRNGGHAMCLVGYEDLPDNPEIGGGRFFLRNSWDGNWGIHSAVNALGYGTIPYAYIARFYVEAYVLR
jgi:hypothetical protein